MHQREQYEQQVQLLTPSSVRKEDGTIRRKVSPVAAVAVCFDTHLGSWCGACNGDADVGLLEGGRVIHAVTCTAGSATGLQRGSAHRSMC